MKVNTVEQFKILEYIKANFEMEHIKVEIIEKNKVKVMDQQKDSVVLSVGYGDKIECDYDIQMIKP